MIAWTKAKTGSRRRAAMACLIAFCLGPAQLLPAVFAFSADLEGSHAVRVQGDFRGDIQLVLHHAPGGVHARMAANNSIPSHDHGVASELICWLAESDQGSGDHVARFATSDSLESLKTTRRHSLGSIFNALPDGLGPEPVAKPILQNESPALRLNESGLIAWQRCLRSTCLLI